MTHKPVLHLLFDDKFIDRAISQFEEALPGYHYYLLDIPSADYNIKYVTEYIDHIDIDIRGSKSYFDKIIAAQPELVILHSMPYFYAHVVNEVLKAQKIIWIFWGGEVYDYLKEFRNKNFKERTKQIANRFLIKSRARNFFRTIYFKMKNPTISWNFSKYAAFKKIDGVALAHPKEFDTLRNELQLNAQLHWFTYYSIEYLVTNDLKKANITGNNILVGNSATLSNNHLDILYQLKNEISLDNRQLIVPLNYGEGWYKSLILKEGDKLFPKNFRALLEFMPLQEYNKIVFSCSVVIMNHLRQQAVGNLIVSFWIGAKVFLDEMNPLFDYFKRIGLIVFSIQKDLAEIQINESLTSLDIEKQQSVLLAHYQSSNVIHATRLMLEAYLHETLR